MNYEQITLRFCALLFAMDDDAEHIFYSFGLDNTSYEEVVNHFNDSFAMSVDVIYKRARFNRKKST